MGRYFKLKIPISYRFKKTDIDPSLLKEAASLHKKWELQRKRRQGVDQPMGSIYARVAYYKFWSFGTYRGSSPKSPRDSWRNLLRLAVKRCT